MPRALLLAAVLLLVAAPADAQRRRDRDGGWFARRGDFALTFSSTLLDAPTEGGVGGRYWVADRSVAAATLGFGVTTVDAPYGGEQDALVTSFGVGFEQHFGHRRNVSPFVGLSARVRHAQADWEEVYYDYPEFPPCVPDEPCPVPEEPTAYPFPVSYGETRLGVAAVLGAEVRLSDGVTVQLAHSLGVTYVRTDLEGAPIYYCETCGGGIPPMEPDYGYDTRRVDFGTGTTAVTLSLYF